MIGPAPLSEDLVGPYRDFLNGALPAVYAQEKALRDDRLTSAQVLFLDNEQKVLVILRKGAQEEDDLLIVQNYSWQTYPSFDVPAPFRSGQSPRLLLNSDDRQWGGRGTAVHLRPLHDNQRLTIEALPAFSTLVIKGPAEE